MAGEARLGQPVVVSEENRRLRNRHRTDRLGHNPQACTVEMDFIIS